MSFNELADVESQVSAMARAERDEHAAAARWDRRDLVRAGGKWHDADRVPDLADVADL